MATPAGLQSPTAETVGAEEEPQHFEVFCVPQGSRQSYTYVSLRLIFHTIKSFFHTN